MEKLSDKLSIALKLVEEEIAKYIEENKFYLDFENKSWASSFNGKALISLNALAINLKHQIETIKKYGL